MNIKFDVAYTIHDYVPPRARKPRALRDQHIDVIVEIPEVDGSRAPIAFILTNNDTLNDHAPVEPYRWYNVQFWTPFRHYYNGNYADAYLKQGWLDPVVSAEKYWPQPQMSEWNSFEVNNDILNKWAEQFIFVDGVLHILKDEPMFNVSRFADRRRNCTYVHIVTKYDVNSGLSFDNNNWRNFFNLNQVAEMNAKANKYFQFGLEDNPPTIYTTVEIFMPETIRHNPKIEHGDSDIKGKTIYLKPEELIQLARDNNNDDLTDVFGWKAFETKLIDNVSWEFGNNSQKEIAIYVRANTGKLIEHNEKVWYAAQADKLTKKDN